MALSMRRVLRRRAPVTAAATVYAAVTNASSRRSAPREATCGLLVFSGGRRAPRLGFVLRRALRHHAVGLHGKALGREVALEHDLGIALERVGHDAGIRGADGLAVALDLEPVVHRVRLARDRVRHNEAMQLQLL